METTYREVINVEVNDQTAGGLRSARSGLSSLQSQAARLARTPIRLLVSVVDRATAPLRGIASQLGKLGELASAFVIGAGLIALPGFLASAAQAAADDAASVSKLQQAVENSGASWAKYGGVLNDTINTGMRLGFTDDAQRDSLALLIAQTGSAEEAQKRMGLAMDLSRGANIDLVTASKLLGKVTDDNVSVLGRYGISVAKGSSETQLFGAIQAKFGGQAETFAKSSAGQMQALSIQMGELKEQVGYLVLPVFTRLVTFANDRLVPLLSNKVIPGIGNLGTSLVRRLNPALVTARALVWAFTRDAGAMGIVVEQVRNVFGDAAGDALDPFANALMRAIPQVKTALADGFSREDLAPVVQALADRAQTAMQSVDLSGAATTFQNRFNDAVSNAATQGAGVQKAAESNASTYVQAFGAEVAASKPIALPGTDKTVSLAPVGTGIEKASGQAGQFGVAFAGLLPLLIVGAKVLPSVVSGVGALATVIGVAASAAAGGAVALGAFLLPLALIAAAVALLYVAWTNDWGGIQEIVAGAIPFIQGLIGQIPAVLDALGAAAQTGLGLLQQGLQAVYTVIQPFLPVWSEIAPHADALWASLQQLLTAVAPAAEAFAQALGPAAQQVSGAFVDIAQVAWPPLKAALETLAPYVSNVLTGSISGWLDVMNTLVNVLQVVLPPAISGAKAVLDSITGTIATIRDGFREAVGAAQSLITILGQIPSPGSVAADAVATVTGRAEGGPVSAGSPYVVGEAGPELFVPGQSGTIVPNGGFSFGDVHLTVNAGGSPGDRRQWREMGRVIVEEFVGELERRSVNVLAGAT